MKLFLDANVLFTAAYSPGGIARALFTLSEADCCVLCTTGFPQEEARRNIALKAPDKLPEIELLCKRITIVPEPGPDAVAWAHALPLALKDAPIMAAAALCGADLLVTGDRLHFNHLYGKYVDGVRVLSPREALNILLETE